MAGNVIWKEEGGHLEDLNNFKKGSDFQYWRTDLTTKNIPENNFGLVIIFPFKSPDNGGYSSGDFGMQLFYSQSGKIWSRNYNYVS